MAVYYQEYHQPFRIPLDRLVPEDEEVSTHSVGTFPERVPPSSHKDIILSRRRWVIRVFDNTFSDNPAFGVVEFYRRKNRLVLALEKGLAKLTGRVVDEWILQEPISLTDKVQKVYLTDIVQDALVESPEELMARALAANSFPIRRRVREVYGCAYFTDRNDHEGLLPQVPLVKISG